MPNKILALDIDETLLNIEPLFFLKKFKKNYLEYSGKIILNQYYLRARPGVLEFLKKAKNHFKIIAFSSADTGYTSLKLKKLSLYKYFSKIYGKEFLVNNKKSLIKIAKDLKKSLKDITLIDNNPKLVVEQKNVIPISPWFIGGDKKDTELSKIWLKLNPIKVHP